MTRNEIKNVYTNCLQFDEVEINLAPKREISFKNQYLIIADAERRLKQQQNQAEKEIHRNSISKRLNEQHRQRRERRRQQQRSVVGMLT